MTKAKEALDEVLEETEEPEVAYGLAGGMTRRDVDDNERFRVKELLQSSLRRVEE